MQRARGFTLIEVLVVLLIFGVLIAMAAVITRAVTAAQKQSMTSTRLATIDAALVQFVMQQKRLPCPADGALASTHINAGSEGARNAAGCTGNQQNGTVPYRVLGLSEGDALDGWDRRLTYRVFPALAADGGMDMTMCDPAGTVQAGVNTATCNIACSSVALSSCTAPYNWLRGKGLDVERVDATVVMRPTPATVNEPPTGAAYVLISHGSTGRGAMTPAGVMVPAEPAEDGDREERNFANVAYVAGYIYVDDSINDTPGPATHFDDIVWRPSIITVVTKAGLGPRSH
jgi:prepilin-type N-terminal cleavage/methylation domain-containing protein